MSILQDIYGGSYAPGESVGKLPQDLSDKCWAFFEEVEKAMGIEFIERHWDDLIEADQYRDQMNFREGFRLGVLLMLEMQSTDPHRFRPHHRRRSKHNR